MQMEAKQHGREKERNLTEKRKDREINSTRQTSRTASDKWAGGSAGATELKENGDFVSISIKKSKQLRASLQLSQNGSSALTVAETQQIENSWAASSLLKHSSSSSILKWATNLEVPASQPARQSRQLMRAICMQTGQTGKAGTVLWKFNLQTTRRAESESLVRRGFIRLHVHYDCDYSKNAWALQLKLNRLGLHLVLCF